MAKKKQQNDQQLALFAPAFPSSIAVKDQQDLMQYPFFSLSKSKRVSPIEYDDGRVQIKVTGADYGIASIFDADILIYLASQLMEADNKGLPTSPEIQVSKYDILEFVGKSTGGKSYKQLKNALIRLKATSVKTSIRPEDGKGSYGMFGWLEDFSVVENRKGSPVAINLTLPRWFYRGVIERKLVLTMNRAYFELEGGLERFMYRLCRKVAGDSSQLQMKMTTVHKRSGLTQKPFRFRAMVNAIQKKQSIPGYWVFVAPRLSTGDEYLCAVSKSRYMTYEDAHMNACSFIAMDNALRKYNEKA